MPDSSSALGASSDLSGTQSGLAVLQRREWVELQTTMDTAYYDYPTTDSEMREFLKMQAGDEYHKEFGETAALFGEFEDVAELFLFTIVPQTMGQVDGILHYNRRVQPIFKRLVKSMEALEDAEMGLLGDDDPTPEELLKGLAKLLKTADESSTEGKIRKKMIRYIEVLAKESNEKRDEAQKLLKLYRTVYDAFAGKAGDEGLVRRFKKQRTDLVAEGGKKDEIKKEIRTKVDEVKADLAEYTQKEFDEEMVLYTSPVYLLIPLAGPLILAAVDTGVGIDLAKTKAKIKSLSAAVEKYEAQIDAADRFGDYFDIAEKLVGKVIPQLEAAMGYVKRLEAGWSNVSGALESASKFLSGDEDAALESAQADEFFLSGPALESAGESWNDAARYAENLRRYMPVKKIKTVDEMMAA